MADLKAGRLGAKCAWKMWLSQQLKCTPKIKEHVARTWEAAQRHPSHWPNWVQLEHQNIKYNNKLLENENMSIHIHDFKRYLNKKRKLLC